MKLLMLGADEINKYIESLDKEIKSLKKHCIHLAWTMRGGMSYNDILNLSSEERDLIADLASDNLQTTEKSGLPYF